MKKIFFVIIFLFYFLKPLNSVRIIQLADIAKWFLESELVFTGKVLKIDTILYDSLKIKLSDNRFEECINGREMYFIKIDSLIKGKYIYDTITVFTPKTCIYYNNYIEEKNERELGENGDTIYSVSIKYFDFYDNSWFRIFDEDK